MFYSGVLSALWDRNIGKRGVHLCVWFFFNRLICIYYSIAKDFKCGVAPSHAVTLLLLLLFLQLLLLLLLHGRYGG